VPVGSEQDDAGAQHFTLRMGRASADSFESFSDLSREGHGDGAGPRHRVLGNHSTLNARLGQEIDQAAGAGR
jgi:hypothetical protein